MTTTTQGNPLTRYPNLLSQWHPEKNKKVKIELLNSNSYRPFWWQCLEKPNHQWKESIHFRVQYPECPFCSPKHPRIKTIQSFLSEHELLDLLKSGDIKPESSILAVSYDTLAQTKSTASKKFIEDFNSAKIEVEEETRAEAKLSKPRLPLLLSSSIATSARELVDQFDLSKNYPHTPESTGWDSSIPIWWKCSSVDSHGWEETPYSRTRQTPFSGCPLCEADKQERLKLQTALGKPSVIAPPDHRTVEIQRTSNAIRKIISRPPVPRPKARTPERQSVEVVNLIFVGTSWIVGGPSAAAYQIERPNQTPVLKGRFIASGSERSTHWTALILGLEALSLENYPQKVIATTHSSMFKHISPLLEDPEAPVSKTTAAFIKKAQELINTFQGFELRETTIDEIKPILAIGQRSIDEHFTKISQLAPSQTNIPLSPNLTPETRVLLEQPFISDNNLAKIKLVNPKDQFSKMRLKTLTKQVETSTLEIFQHALEEIETQMPNSIKPPGESDPALEIALRWHLRGLPIALALRKTLS